MKPATIDLDAAVLVPGRWQLTMRLPKGNRRQIQHAAATLGMPAAKFCRLVVWQAAMHVLENDPKRTI